MASELDSVPVKSQDPYIARFQYYLKDHLGNTMVIYEDRDKDLLIKPEDQEHAYDVVERFMYYPFGMKWEDVWPLDFNPEVDEENRYLYNGKELHRGSGLYDYGFRYYLAEIGRFMGVDPIAEDFPHVTVYNYAENRPIDGIDLWGLQYVNFMHQFQNMFDGFLNKSGLNRTLEKVNSNEYRVSKSAQANAEKGLRLGMYAGVTVGGIITTVVSAGTLTAPYAAAFGALTGVYATSAGVSMTIAELAGQPGAAASIPGTPLGVLGRAIDEATNNQSLSVETLADIANGVLILGSSDFSKFDALNNADKLGTISGIIDGVFNLAGQSVDPKQTQDYSQQVLDKINSCKKSCDGN